MYLGRWGEALFQRIDIGRVIEVRANDIINGEEGNRRIGGRELTGC